MTNESNGSCPWCGGVDRDTRPLDDEGVPCANTWHTTRRMRVVPTETPPVEAEIRRRLDPLNDQPELPYGSDDDRTSGFAGSETSEARAREADQSGATGHRQMQAMWALEAAGIKGLTWRELGDEIGLHHGSASGVLSVLHKAGQIDRLAEKRNRCKVYVLPHNTGGRAIEKQGRTAASGLLKEAVEVLRAHGECTFHRLAYPEPDCISCRGAEVVAAYDRRNSE